VNIPGNNNTCQASVMDVGQACARTIHQGKANGRIPDASGGMPHPTQYEGNAAARGPTPPIHYKFPGVPGNHNGTNGVLA